MVSAKTFIGQWHFGYGHQVYGHVSLTLVNDIWPWVSLEKLSKKVLLTGCILSHLIISPYKQPHLKISKSKKNTFSPHCSCCQGKTWPSRGLLRRKGRYRRSWSCRRRSPPTCPGTCPPPSWSSSPSSSARWRRSRASVCRSPSRRCCVWCPQRTWKVRKFWVWRKENWNVWIVDQLRNSDLKYLVNSISSTSDMRSDCSFTKSSLFKEPERSAPKRYLGVFSVYFKLCFCRSLSFALITVM